MQTPEEYRAEFAYRQAQIRRDWEPIRQRRRARTLDRLAYRDK